MWRRPAAGLRLPFMFLQLWARSSFSNYCKASGVLLEQFSWLACCKTFLAVDGEVKPDIE